MSNKRTNKPTVKGKSSRTSVPKKPVKRTSSTGAKKPGAKTRGKKPIDKKVGNKSLGSAKKTGQSNTKKSITSLKNKKQLQLKYKRRRRLLGLVFAVAFIGIIIIYKSHSSEGNLNEYMTQGNNFVVNSQYQNAINCYKEVLDIDSNNQKAKDLVQILGCYLKAQTQYENGNVQGAEQTIQGMNPDYTRYPIGVKINQLKAELNNGSTGQSATSNSPTSNDTKNDLMNLNTYYSNGQYRQALDLIKRLNTENLNSTQQAYVAEMEFTVEKSLGMTPGQTQLSKKGQYLTELDNLNVQVNNMELNAKSYDQKLQRAKDKYNVWNDELSKIYTYLQNKLQGQQLNELQTGEQTFESEKTQKAQASEAQYNQQIVKDTANYQTQRSLTKERCYYLVNTYM